MNLGLLDWGIVAAMVLFMVIAARRTKKYTRSVADFLAANRCAGRCLRQFCCSDLENPMGSPC